MQSQPILETPTGFRRRIAVASVLLAMAAAVLDASSINIALPLIADALGMAPATVALLVVAYQGALLVGLLPLAAVGERFGLRRTFMSGVVLFAFCASASSFCSNFVALVFLRIVQGLGAAAIMALGVALLRQAVAPEKLGEAIGWNAMTVALMSAAGPAVGAVLLELGSWRSVFSGGASLALLSLAVSSALPASSQPNRAFDVVGASLYILAASTVVIGAALFRNWPISSIWLVAIGCTGLWFLARRDRQRLTPFLPIDLFRLIAFRRSVFASLACFTGLSLALLILPFSLHARLDVHPIQIALLMTPWPLAVLLTTPVTTKLLCRFDTRTLCTVGGLCISSGFGILAFSADRPGIAIHLLGVLACGFGFGLFQTPNNRIIFLAASVDRAASAGGVQGTARLLGQASGAVMASGLLSTLTLQGATPFALLLAATATLIAALLSFRRDNELGVLIVN